MAAPPSDAQGQVPSEDEESLTDFRETMLAFLAPERGRRDISEMSDAYLRRLRVQMRHLRRFEALRRRHVSVRSRQLRRRLHVLAHEVVMHATAGATHNMAVHVSTHTMVDETARLPTSPRW